ncbi:hypothetical protein I203_102098 [Kwoniella mangroviensis CBS 8507]|uniref:uncharacterized protein n=1 Tax=Kwoniella mangroviensis CBS 8507 TaxID=1296122 RepID=UPI00080D15EF|nr:cytoplasmic protein [Kwoniella mangroviensis CBS 8507]OCF67596.1 cytoplasmic protein [Kwoniella mangroviensis CBS 8507]
MEDEDPPQLLDVPSSDDEEAGSSRDLYDRPKIPLTLLTGYLGAGKSTLLDYILKEEHGYKIAVCMNDFGDTTDIEAKSLTLSDPNSQSTTTEFLSLPNGCLCCSFKDMGIAAIEEMVANAPGGIDWVMVELTGVADPGPIVRSFWANEEMGDLILDGVVCVVDSRNVLKQLAEQREGDEINECQKQVACADVILLNKLDLVTPEQMKEVESTIRTINPTLRVHHTTQSKAPLSDLFNLRAFSDPTALASTKSTTNHVQNHDHDHSSDDCSHPSHAQTHTNGISTILIPLPTLNQKQYFRLNEFLESILWDNRYPISKKPSPEILRSKGYIRLDDGREYVLQGVADLFELKELPGSEQKEGQGKVVFIGKNVGEEVKVALKEFVGI